MPSDLINLHEYELVEYSDGRYIYVVDETTLHPDLEAAGRWVARRIREGAIGKGIETEAGTLPGRSWTTSLVTATEFEINVGHDIQSAKFWIPVNDAMAEADEILRLEQEYDAEVEDDSEPLPPDE